MFKRASLIVSAFIISIFSFMINVSQVSAFTLKGNWSPPQVQMFFKPTVDVNYEAVNDLGCFGAATSNCGSFTSGNFTTLGYALSAGSTGYRFYKFDAKSSAGATENIHGRGTLARAQISINYFVDVGNPNVQLMGATRVLNWNDNDVVYFPLGIENVHTTKLLNSENYYPFEYSTTFDIVYVQSSAGTNGVPHFLADFYIGSSAQNGAAYVSVNNIVYYSDYDQYAADTSNTLTDIKGLVQSISQNSSNAAVVQQQVITNSKLDDVNTNIVNLQQTQQQGNDDAQSRWEQDKQEESDRESQGNDDADTLSSLFSFTAFNPFSGLFGLFTGSDSCVAIPTIARLANAPANTTYCPWFPANVRSILTPVIGISSMMLLFGFFIHWLNGSSKSFIIKEK